MRKFDTLLKILLRRWGSGIVTQLTGETAAAWLDVELPKVSTRCADLLIKTASGRLCHLELQSWNDSEMLARMLEYGVWIFRMLGLFPDQFVLYVGREPLRMDAAIQVGSLNYSYHLIDVRDLDVESLLASNEVGDNIVAILGKLNSPREAVRRILTAIGRLEPAQRRVALRILLLLSNLRELEETIEREAKNMPVFDYILENKVLGREFKRGEEKGLERGREQGLEQGLERGREQGLERGLVQGMERGLERGREEGVRKGEIAIVRRLIAKRFGCVPPSLDKRFDTLSLTELEQMADRVFDVNSPDELLS